jgi:hypothetical protein
MRSVRARAHVYSEHRLSELVSRGADGEREARPFLIAVFQLEEALNELSAWLRD